jgi:hypothetical protein
MTTDIDHVYATLRWLQPIARDDAGGKHVVQWVGIDIPVTITLLRRGNRV